MTNQAIESGDLRVVFLWRGDRFGHTIERLASDAWQVFLESMEGSPDEDWPPGPALQSLHIEQREYGPVALLVGKAGTSHWSASIEPLPTEQSIRFDVACRVARPPQYLGTAYRLADNRTHPRIRLSPPPHEAACEMVRQLDNSIWQIRPAGVDRDYPSTIRWRYMISASP